MDKNLISAALRYRATALFKLLDDSQIFAVRLDDGEIGYCCVMGNSGTHYALALYRGKSGFNTYLHTLFPPKVTSPIDLFEYQLGLRAVNCEFENAADSLWSKSDRDKIKKIADEEGLKICRPKGWPEFIIYDGSHHTLIPSEQQRRNLIVALDAACEIARSIESLKLDDIIQLGLAPHYAPLEGGKKIPLLSRGKDGVWQWSDTVTPPYAADEEEYVTPKFDNEEMIKKIQRIRHRGNMECRIIHFPVTVGCKEDNYHPIAMIADMLPDGMVPFVPSAFSDIDDEDVDFAILDKFAEDLISSDICPATIQTDDRRTYLCLEDFCEKTGIRLRRVDKLVFVPQIWMMLQHMC